MASERRGPAADIERISMRTLSMRTDIATALPSCHQQGASPLYNKLPKELRDLCFVFATAQYEDLSRKYSDHAFFCRPGHTAPLTTCTNLLLTCRRVWLEAYALPLKQSEFTAWRDISRGPRQRHTGASIENLTTLNKKCLSTMHFFLQMVAAENMFHFDTPEILIFTELQPKTFHVTIRHTDWFWWEHDRPLALDDYWVRRFLNAPHLSSVQTFKLELETLTKNKPQLDAIVENLSQLEGAVHPAQGGTHRKFKFDGISAPWQWIGPTNINKASYEPYRNLKQLDYHVVTLTWRSRDTTDPLTEIPKEPATRDRGTHPFPCHINSTTRFTSNRAQFGLLRTVFEGRRHFPPVRHRKRMPMARYFVELESGRKAAKHLEDMRWHFQKAFADIEARKYEQLWANQGSLLRFAGS